VRPGHVVVHLVLGQDDAQIAFPEDQRGQGVLGAGCRRAARR
jgi:hypothetical protein